VDDVQPFRFGYQTRARTVDELRDDAQRAEQAGFDIIHTSDHIGGRWSPLMPLAVAACATSSIEIGPLVVNNDLHHPVQLAMEVADLDHLSGGRVELGIGAGHSFTEYEAIGLHFDPPAVRKQRMIEAVQIIRTLLDGGTVNVAGEHYRVTDVTTKPSMRERLPIMVAVNGAAALKAAAAVADVIGLTMLGKTLADGHNHEVRWQADRLDATIGVIRAAAAPERTPRVNALVQVVQITDDREAALREIVDELPSLSMDDARTTPFLAIGTHDEIAAQWLAARDRWGIDYLSVRDIDAIAPVIERLRNGA
jgi:probable F420-dependent oxidoreductase